MVALKQATRIPKAASPRSPSYDVDLLSAALFGDDDGGGAPLSSLENAISPSRRRAEEYDRYAEEEHALASAVRGAVATGGLVDEARRGVDVGPKSDVDVEEAMRREAADRRGRTELRRGGALAGDVGGGGGGGRRAPTPSDRSGRPTV